jgi:hypothetical protein
MPINEDVIDAVVHFMAHYFDDYPDAVDVDEDTLASYVLERGLCDQCVANFVAETGGTSLGDAIGQVWDSEPWQALRARTLASEEEDMC